VSGASQKENCEALLARLMRLEPKELMKEIVNGHVPLNMLNQVIASPVTHLLPLDVHYLENLIITYLLLD